MRRAVVVVVMMVVMVGMMWGYHGYSFKRIATLPHGQNGHYGCISVGDMDQDGLKEIIINVCDEGFFVFDYEYDGGNGYILQDSFYTDGGVCWGPGHLDLDSLYDLPFFNGDVVVWEDLESTGFPETTVWNAGISSPYVHPIWNVDLDRDGAMEMLVK